MKKLLLSSLMLAAGIFAASAAEATRAKAQWFQSTTLQAQQSVCIPATQ